ncbi:hypothetical protein F4V91_00555 [Neorhizobium galegae]|uniref:Uncharacterized protein n=2 Tax=Neorhizobium galegae TaxID=399 RepID=A0A6A1TLJ2_NEOGA|nr:hypothetical protein F4V91_00555 [Neorhizobium galegae]
MFEESCCKGGWVECIGQRGHNAGIEQSKEAQMRYEKWKRLPARQKAVWPAHDKGYLDPQHKVSISLDADLAQWLVENVVGGGSYYSDLEETIITTLRVLRRDVTQRRSQQPGKSAH